MNFNRRALLGGFFAAALAPSIPKAAPFVGGRVVEYTTATGRLVPFDGVVSDVLTYRTPISMADLRLIDAWMASRMGGD